jgi:hypothetical protein
MATLYMEHYKKKQEKILYTFKTQKPVEPKVDASVLQTTRFTKHPLDHTTLYSNQFHTLHQNLPLTSHHCPYINFTSHPALNPFPSPHLADYLDVGKWPASRSTML